MLSDNSAVVHVADGCAVTGALSAARERYVMVLNESRARDSHRKIGVISPVVIAHTQSLCRRTVGVCTKHFEIFIHAFEAQTAVIGDVELGAASLLCRHFDDARCPTAAVRSGFGGILQDGKALYISGVNAVQRGNIAVHAVNNNKRVVASGQRRGAAHAHRTEHSHAVGTRRTHVHTGGLSAQCAQRVDDEALVHAPFSHNIYRPVMRKQRAFTCRGRYYTVGRQLVFLGREGLAERCTKTDGDENRLIHRA